MPTSPHGWLICNGSEVSRDTYSSVFNIVGINLGDGDDHYTFNLPDYRGTGTQDNYSGPALNTSQNHATQPLLGPKIFL